MFIIDQINALIECISSFTTAIDLMINNFLNLISLLFSFIDKVVMYFLIIVDLFKRGGFIIIFTIVFFLLLVINQHIDVDHY